MTASERIKTPRMDLPVKPGSKAKKRAKRLQRTFTKVRLAQVQAANATGMCPTQMTVKSNCPIAIATLGDWLKNLTPVF